jgi:hypothetical protein
VREVFALFFFLRALWLSATYVCANILRPDTVLALWFVFSGKNHFFCVEWFGRFVKIPFVAPNYSAALKFTAFSAHRPAGKQSHP